MNLNIESLKQNYLDNRVTIREVIENIKKSIEENKDSNIWIYTLSDEEP